MAEPSTLNYGVVQRKAGLQLPKLKAHLQLLQVLPELRRYFPDSPAPASQAVTSTQDRSVGFQTLKERNPSKLQSRDIADDSDDEQERESRRLANQLKQAKHERSELLKALAAARKASFLLPSSSYDEQQRDIDSLRGSLTQKQEMLNALREKHLQLEQTIIGLELEHRDCWLSVPSRDGDPSSPFAISADALTARLAQLEMVTKETQTRTDQYRLLIDRTNRDRDAAENRMRVAREAKSAAEDDVYTITAFFYSTQAAKEGAERALGAAVTHLDTVRARWQRKLRERRKEVRSLERFRAEEHAEIEAQAAEADRVRAKSAAEKEAARQRAVEKAAEQNDPEVLRKLGEAEAAWARLQALAGAQGITQIIEAWHDLQGRSQALQDLLSLAYNREASLRETQNEMQQVGSTDNALTPGKDEHGAQISTESTEDDLRNPQKAAADSASTAMAAVMIEEQSGNENKHQDTQQRNAPAESPSGSNVCRGGALQSVESRHQAVERVSASVELALTSLRDRLYGCKETIREADHLRRGSLDSVPGEGPKDTLSTLRQDAQQGPAGNSGRQSRGMFRRTSGPGVVPVKDQKRSQLQRRSVIDRRSILPPRRISALSLSHIRGNPASGGKSCRTSIVGAREMPRSSIRIDETDCKFINSEGALPSADDDPHSVQPPGGSAVDLRVQGLKLSRLAKEIGLLVDYLVRYSPMPASTSIHDAVGPPSVRHPTDVQMDKNQIQDFTTTAQLRAVELHLARLVGATDEPAPKQDDPFRLQSSDEEGDNIVMDRAALKQRSHKIIRSKKSGTVR